MKKERTARIMMNEHKRRTGIGINETNKYFTGVALYSDVKTS